CWQIDVKLDTYVCAPGANRTLLRPSRPRDRVERPPRPARGRRGPRRRKPPKSSGSALPPGPRPRKVRPESFAGLAGDYEELMSSWLARELGRPKTQIHVERPFAEMGVDSIRATALVEELERHAGQLLRPTLPWDFPTIRSLAHHLAGLGEVKPDEIGRL